MDVRFLKWGNSVAVRIPAPVLRDLGVAEGSLAELAVVDGKLVVTPVARRRRIPLGDYVARITPENLHDEVFAGPPAGSETW